LGIFFNLAYTNGILPFSLNAQQIVSVPVPNSMADFIGQFTFPDFFTFSTFSYEIGTSDYLFFIEFKTLSTLLVKSSILIK
jgi:hypothetical protein